MSEIAAPPPLDHPGGESPDRPLGRLARLGDRVNPILVREVHQALNGKAFLITASLALLSILIIALVVSAQQDVGARNGRAAFRIALQVLAPIIFFILPFQAFLSMRGEVGGGTVEHLLLSRLRPGAIVRGKLYAATVQFMIYLAIFSPLIAMTFLLRGVDVPTIAVMLTLAFTYAVAAGAFAIACGALCRWRTFFRVIPFAAVLVGLFMLTYGAVRMLEFEVWTLRRALSQPDFHRVFAYLNMPAVVVTILFSMLGSAVLAHPYENRSTKFRIFGAAWIIAGSLWFLYEYRAYAAGRTTGSFSVTHLADVMAYFVGSSAVVLFLFAYFAATEPTRLSPRVRTHVPRSTVLALLAAPFLPGHGRGMLYTLLLCTLAIGAMFIVPIVGGAAPGRAESEVGFAILGWIYVLLYAGLGSFVRRFLSGAASRNWVARAVLPVLLLGSALLPLFAALLTASRLGRWSLLHVFNPFSTLKEYGLYAARSGVMPVMVTLAVFVILLNIPAMVSGLAEVVAAARARRRHERTQRDGGQRNGGQRES